METPGLALQLRLSEERFQNWKWLFNNGEAIWNDSNLLCVLQWKFFHVSLSSIILGSELNKNKNCLEKEVSYCLSVFFFIMGNIDQGSWEFLGEKGEAESALQLYEMHYNYQEKDTFLIHEAQPLKCKDLFQSPHPDLFSQETERKRSLIRGRASGAVCPALSLPPEGGPWERALHWDTNTSRTPEPFPARMSWEPVFNNCTAPPMMPGWMERLGHTPFSATQSSFPGRECMG